MSRVLVIGSFVPISREIGAALSAADIPTEYAHGDADALQQLRAKAFGLVITSPESTVEEDLALFREMRAIRPGVKCILLAHHSTPAEVIAALRAHVFACFSPPFDLGDIVSIAHSAASDTEWRNDIEVLSAKPGWVSVRVNCRLINAERLMTFAKELTEQLPEGIRLDLLQALREILLNAMEHGAGYDPDKIVEVTAVRTGRAMVFYVHDPGHGFHRESLTHAAIANPPGDPAAHIKERREKGMRPGGFGLLMASGTVDELIYSEIGNEVVLIKYVDTPIEEPAPPPLPLGPPSRYKN
jgi:anti-sigma regulatory factor (Ser/Thr protein kinase)/ActR/RegA family two-component response regulator